MRAFIFLLFFALVFAQCPCGESCQCDGGTCPVVIDPGLSRSFSFVTTNKQATQVVFESDELISVVACVGNYFDEITEQCGFSHFRTEEPTTCVSHLDPLTIQFYTVIYVVSCESVENSCSVAYRFV